ncbi:hypothetical protein OG401_21160 [Kitasatospora purpeofusca]|uniref:hypothetical protein n=1 Tax=Kitasatospora purpeofusca TaxID=67352 RepID=UPI00225746BB|nr:hypothetical protein [Kitasatospora purpeofusca]MCX4686791.1 hypothetical protein [Kitasatospora purpeofusca]
MKKPNPTIYERAAKTLNAVRNTGHGPTVERLAAIYDLDLDAVVPQALTWADRTRSVARRLLRTVAPVLRELVTEIVVLDRQLQEADDRIAELTEPPTTPPTDLTDPHGRLAAAHTVLGRLVPTLNPAPSVVTVESCSWQGTPVIEVSVFHDLGAIQSWAAALGAEVVQKETSSGITYITATCAIDGITVRMTTTLSTVAPVEVTA